MRTVSPSRNARQRNPSHFGSYNHSEPLGSAAADSASMGSYGKARGRLTRNSAFGASRRATPRVFPTPTPDRTSPSAPASPSKDLRPAALYSVRWSSENRPSRTPARPLPTSPASTPPPVH